MIIIKDKSPIQKATYDETSGFLTAPVTLSRIGVQEYFGFELDSKLEPSKKYGVFRSPDEVFDKSSVDSFINLVSTDDHPSVPVTLSNVKDLQVGSVSGVEGSSDGKTLEGLLTLTDAATIKKVRDGKAEVSVGYAHELVEESGVYEGINYDFVQTNIKANHLAIVDAGRCGAACKITIDHKKENTMIITIDGIEYNTEDTQLAQAVKKQQSAYDAEFKKFEKKSEEDEEEMKKLKKEKDEAEATKDALVADSAKFSDDAISKLVADKALLLNDAKAILGDKMPECTSCDKEIKAAVIAEVNGLDVSGKSDEYINAGYDMALIKYAEAKDSVKKLNGDFQKDGKTTRETAQATYVADHLNGGKK